MLNKETIKKMASEKCFINQNDGFRVCYDLDGSEARRYLEAAGFTVVKNYDNKINGLAITDCGIYLSTNGYVYRK